LKIEVNERIDFRSKGRQQYCTLLDIQASPVEKIGQSCRVWHGSGKSRIERKEERKEAENKKFRIS
jgi:hypothetical protein